MTIFECQNCGETFEIETPQTEDEKEKITCPYCYSGDVIDYEEEE